MTFIVSWSIAFDTIISVSEPFEQHITQTNLTKLSVWFFSPTVTKSSWGTAHNITYNLWLLWHKEETIMLGTVGKDFVTETQQQQYINYDHIHHKANELTAGAYIFSDPNGHQITSFHPGALAFSQEQSLPTKQIKETNTYVILAPNDVNATLIQAQQWHDAGYTLFFDPGQAISFFSKEQLLHMCSLCHYFICNEYERSQMQSLTGLGENELRGLFEKVIITLAERGVDIYTQHTSTHVDGIKIDKVIDATGAGDAFRAWLVSWLSEWLSREHAAQRGNAIASLVVQQPTTMGHEYSREEILTRTQQFYW